MSGGKNYKNDARNNTKITNKNLRVSSCELVDRFFINAATTLEIGALPIVDEIIISNLPTQ
jgi:hypothetical protein